MKWLMIILFAVIFSDSLKVDSSKSVKALYIEQKAFNEDLKYIRSYLRAKRDSTIIDSTIVDSTNER